MMIDENAFGILISDIDVEDAEYELSREEFLPRLRAFHDAVFDFVALNPLASDARALDLGHAVYFEFGEGEQIGDPLAWLRRLREAVRERGLASVGIMTHGSRWVDETAGVALEVEQRYVGSVPVAGFSSSSEPLRRALYADTATRPPDDEQEGWGAGFYVDTEAIEALGLTPKNRPTGLVIAGATFYRVGR